PIPSPCTAICTSAPDNRSSPRTSPCRRRSCRRESRPASLATPPPCPSPPRPQPSNGTSAAYSSPQNRRRPSTFRSHPPHEQQATPPATEPGPQAATDSSFTPPKSKRVY